MKPQKRGSIKTFVSLVRRYISFDEPLAKSMLYTYGYVFNISI